VSTRRETLAGLAWVSPWLIGGTAFLFVPMGMSLWYSLTDYPLLKPPVFVGTANYAEMLGDARFWLTVRNTAVYAALAIPLCTAAALAIAGAINASGARLSRLLLAAIFLPTLVPMIAAAMIWLWLLNPRYGLINHTLASVGLPAPNWLGDPRLAIPAMLLVALWGIGQSVVIYVAAMQEVPRSLYEAAEIDGVRPLRRFWSVTLPMISPQILFNVITLTIATLQVFVVPYVLFRNERGQRNEGYFYSMYLFDNAFVYQRMGYASAMAWIQLLIVLGLTWVMFAMSRRVVHYRG
jgi:multiple sugar transport system permease protein